MGAHHNSSTGRASQQTSCCFGGGAEEAGHMLILPEDDANEEEYGRQACRRKFQAVDKYKQADDELAWTIDSNFFFQIRENSL